MLQLHGKIPFVFEQDFGDVFKRDLERSFWDQLTDWREDAIEYLFSYLEEAVRAENREGRIVDTSFSVAASKAQDILKMTDVDLNDLDLPTSPSRLPRGCVEWLERVNSTFVGSGESCEAAARQQIDPILHAALPEKSGITIHLEMSIDTSAISSLCESGVVFRGKLDYCFSKDGILGEVEAKSPRAYKTSFTKCMSQLALQLYGVLYPQLLKTTSSSVRCCWGFLTDGNLYTLLVLDSSLRLLQVRDMPPEMAMTIINHLLEKRSHLCDRLTLLLETERKSLETDPVTTGWHNYDLKH